jgi:STE24 endopeptidase
MRSGLLALIVLATLSLPALCRAQSGPNKSPDKPITSYSLSPELYRKARNLNRFRFAYRITGLFYGLLVLCLILKTGRSARFRDWAESRTRNRYFQALIFTALLALTIGLLNLPLEAVSHRVMRLYRISVQPWGSWLGDWAKAQALLILFGGALTWILFAVMRRSPRRWWFYFWLISIPIFLAVFFAEPYVIDPLFFEYQPLGSKAPELVPQLERVVEHAGQQIPPGRMFWMKASEKTNATNAYVTGIGASKRVVIWDTTLQQETPDEVTSDFGHELGHYVLHHVWKGLAFGAVLTLLLLYAAYRTVGRLLARYGQGLGIRGVDDLASLPALLLVISIFGSVGDVASNTFSRYIEAEADLYGQEVVHGIIPDGGQAAARSFQKAGEVYLADPAPNPVYVFLFYDHPPIGDRVRFFVTYDPWSKGQPRQFVQ